MPIPPPQTSGPVTELKAAFENEPRDSAARTPESRIESEFKRTEMPAGLLKSVMCRKTVCRVETVWSPARAEGFMGAFMRLISDFKPTLALDTHGAPDAQGDLRIDVYLERLDPDAKPAEP